MRFKAHLLLLYNLLIYGSYSSTIKFHISVDYVVVTADVDMRHIWRHIYGICLWELVLETLVSRLYTCYRDWKRGVGTRLKRKGNVWGV